MKVNLLPTKETWQKIKDLLPANKEKQIKKQWLIITIIVAVFVILILGVGLTLAFEIRYYDKFFPGSRLGQINLEGLNFDQAAERVAQAAEQIEKNGIQISANQTTLTVTANLKALNDPDLSREIMTIDSYQTVEAAYAFGRNENWWQNIITHFKMFFVDQNFAAIYNLNENYLKDLLQEKFSSLEQPSLNARPVINWQADGSYQIEIAEEQTGYVIDYQNLIEKFKKNLAGLSAKPIILEQTIVQSTVKKSEVLNKIDLVNWLLNTSSPQLIYQEEAWEIKKAELTSLLVFAKDQNQQIGLGFDCRLLDEWLNRKAAPMINTEPQDASLKMVDGKVTEFSVHRDGQKLDLEASCQKLNENLAQKSLTSELAVEIIKPKIVTEEINNLGIKEIIGVGHSNFSGSPTNRRHNIKNGAQSLAGVLIKPDEEFSLVTALGRIEADTGYLPELVIKGNQTVPEYGGGLCQIGTTIFRAALASGLPILERASHAYSVSYYLENGLPGVDATIYVPKPDVRFKNDTGHYILIQYQIKGDDIYFEFWGAKDGRTVGISKPRVWNWVAPPATKYIETLDLAPGQKKCTEKAHRGVDAAFDYKVVYPSGEVKERTFTSHYKPWQEVCLIGVAELTATSTEAMVSPE